MSDAPRHHAGMAALSLGALGVVFGDIGTSPLYALQTVFAADNHAVRPTEDGVYGVISLVFWAITLIVSVKYVALIMRADNEGEGGIMALIALIRQVGLQRRAAQVALVALGIFGASLFYGDGMITPAISVLSAVEGIEVVAPDLHSLVVPITLVIITGLFTLQRFGTGAVGRLFGPVMGVWFTLLAILGFKEVVTEPAILRAVSPTYGISFLFEHGHVAFIALGSVVLTVTGAEALYADMGHFGRPPIRRAWFFAVFPALILNYMGQGSLILESPQAIDNPFFLLVPHWGRLPMVLLATVATVIASQAVISGAFSVTRQAVRLGFLPRVTIRHTSAREVGQVYAPAVNWALLVAVIALVVGFGSSAKLASAYGIAVTGTITVDTLLFFVVARALWKKPAWLVGLGAAVFFTVDFAFLGANLTKIHHGGWFPLTVGALIFIVLSTWRRGSDRVNKERVEAEGSLSQFVEELHTFDPPAARVPGTAVYLNARRETTPLALRRGLEYNRALHETIVIISIETTKAPYVPEADRLVVDHLGFEDDGISHLTARFGFQEPTDVPRLLKLAEERGIEGEIDCDGAVYFLSQISIVPGAHHGLQRWRKHLFIALARNASSPVDYFKLPRERTISIGSQIEL